MEQKYSTGSMLLPTSNHSLMTCGGADALDSTTTYNIRGIMEQKYSTGSMLLPTSSHSLKTCGGADALDSTTTYII